MSQPAGDPAADEVLAGAAGPDAPSLAAACEAVLLLVDEPLDTATLAAVVGRSQAEVAQCLAELAAQYTRDGRGFDLRETGGRWRYYTRDTCADVVARYVTDGQSARLSQAALETLAIVAYRQPIPRARISAIRGVNVDGVVRTLLTRGLVAEAGSDPDSHATLLVTTAHFLDRLGIASLAELPPLAEHVPGYEQLGELDLDEMRDVGEGR